MASGTQGADERILEGRHVIGLFFLMLLLSGAFFTLGYVIGRNDGQVAAASDHLPNTPLATSSDAKRKASSVHSGTGSDATTPPNSDWEFYRAEEKKPDDVYQKGSSKRTVNPKGQVGPDSHPKAPEIARKGLKKVGLKAIVKRS